MSENLIGGVTAKVTSDNTQFDASWKRSAEVVTASAASATKAAKQAAEAQAFAAKFAGDAVSAQSLRMVQSIKVENAARADLRKAQQLARTDFAGEAEAINLVAAAYQRKALATEASAVAMAAAGAKEEVYISKQMAASAAIRGLEGNVGIRSVERFVTTIPGVGKALQGIFPLVGAAAFIGIIAKSAEEIYQLEQTAKHAGAEMQKAFEEMNVKLAESNDQLELANSKTADEIAKLEKHPSNGLATALLEAKVAADKLQESLSADLKSLNALLKEHDTGFFGGLMAGSAPTGKNSKEIADYNNGIEARAQAVAATEVKALQASGTNQAARKAATAAYYTAIDGLAAEAARKMRGREDDVQALQNRSNSMAQANWEKTDYTQQKAEFNDAAVVYDKLQRRAQLSGTSFDQDQVVNKLRGDGKTAPAAKESTAIKEMIREAEEAKRVDAEIHEALTRTWEEANRQDEESAKRHEKFDQDQRDRAARLAASQAETAAHLAGEQARLGEENAKQAAGISALIRQHELARGAITAHDAAMQTMAAHALEYQTQLDNIEEARAALTPADLAEGRGVALEREKRRVQGEAGRAEFNDGNAAQDTTMYGAAKLAVQEFAAAATDGAKIMQTLVSGTLNKVNDTIITELTTRSHRGPQFAWSHVGAGLGREVASASLKAGEANLLKMLTHSKAKPALQPVQVMNWPPSMGKDGMASHLPAALAKTGTGGGFLSGLMGMASNILIPGFASGGDPAAGTTAWVGEAGPELVHFGSAAHVTPNNQLRGGGNTNHTWNIDARGSGDPAAVQMAVQRGIREAAPHLIAASVKATAEHAWRTGSSR
jgi:hypothetical protein